MNFKVFYRLILIITITFILTAGAVYAGIKISHIIAGIDKTPDLGAAEKINLKTNKIKSTKHQKVNVAVLGLDEAGYRTDTIIFVQYNPDGKKVNMLQIPRDTKVETNRRDKKINSAYGFGGESELLKSIEDIVGLKVDKHIFVNIGGFRKLIDTIGGVKMNVPIDMDYIDPIQEFTINLKKGEQVLNGKKAEMFVRFRQNSDGTGYPEGDVGRVKAQQDFIKATLNKLLSLRTIIKIPSIISIMMKNVKTDFKTSEIASYIKDGFKMSKDNLNIMLLPGKGQYINGISYYIYEKKQTQKLIDENFIK